MTFLAPKRYVASVDCIDLDELYRSGKRALLVDRDNTLVPRDAACALPRLAIGLTGRADLVFAFVLCLTTGTAARSRLLPASLV